MKERDRFKAKGGAFLWLIDRGPHGPSFEWGASKNKPRGYISLEHLRKSIEEAREKDPSSIKALRQAALELLEAEDPELVRRAIQVLSVVGEDEDLKIIAEFLEDPDPDVRKDAKACLFERRYRP